MKRTLATTAALALCAALCLPAVAQQTTPPPASPNPGNPPVEGPNANRGDKGTTPSATGGGMSSDSSMHKDAAKPKKDPTARSKKPREQNAAPYPTADAPSGPKGDSPDPAPKQ